MSLNYENQSLVFFAVDYRTDLGLRLPAAANDLYNLVKPDDVRFHVGLNYTFQWFGKKKIFVVSHNRITSQTIGVATWKQESDNFISMTTSTLKKLEVTELKRIGFKLIAFVPQTMSHAELSDLFFGSFLAPMDEWDGVCQKPNDPFLQLGGERNGMKFLASLTAQTQDQIRSSIQASQNFDHFSKPQQIEPSILEFVVQASNNPCLMLDIDLFREDGTIDDVGQFGKQALKNAEEIVRSCVAKLQSKEIADVR